MAENWEKYLATGVKVAPGAKVALRKDLRDLNQDELYLYVEGLKKFQSQDKSDWLSYFQIAGIHGMPYENWPNEKWNDIKLLPRSGAGFCTHSSILFLTWHRPYLALFESAFQTHVKDIAKGIASDNPKRDSYLQIAESFRIPFWDWARKDTQIIPRQTLDPNLVVKGPPSSNASKGDYNPLYAFPFSQGTDPKITRGWKTTVRYPPNKDQKGKTLIDSIWDIYERPEGPRSGGPTIQPERNLTERVSYLLQSYDSYRAICNNAWQPDKTGPNKFENYGSLEDVHNAFHNAIGGAGGHMSGIDVSAFDPMFWLHHANIDRLYAIWQALHETEEARTFVTATNSGMNTATAGAGSRETADSKLYPFKRTVDDWYTSNETKRTEDFGYTYDEIAGIPEYPAAQKYRDAINLKIKKQYPPAAEIIRQSLAHKKTAGEALLPQAQALKVLTQESIPATTENLDRIMDKLPSDTELLDTSLQPGKPVLRSAVSDGKYLEWLVNIRSEKHALDGGYKVYVFLGPPDETNVALWSASPNYVGLFSPLGQGENTGCEKCQEDQRDRLEVTGQIPLTIALLERLLADIIENLDESTVERFLSENLHWRVVQSDGTILENRSQVNGLLVAVVSNEVTLPDDETSLPIYAPTVKPYPNITTKAGTSDGRGDGTGLTA